MLQKITFIALFILISGPNMLFAIEPMDPVTMCERFIGEKEKASCTEKAKKYDLDWYAASICYQLEEDKLFFKCWDNINGFAFNPKQLEKCDGNKETPDESRYACIHNQKFHKNSSHRIPAAAEKNTFQSLKLRIEK